MDRFIRNENIRRYKELLDTELNEDKREIIRRLLAEEEAKQFSSKPSAPQSKHT